MRRLLMARSDSMDAMFASMAMRAGVNR